MERDLPYFDWKYYILIFFDLLSMQISFVLSYYLVINVENPYENYSYRLMAVLLVLNQLITTVFLDIYKDFHSRGYLREFTNLLFYSLTIGILVITLMFIMRSIADISPMQFVITFVFYPFIAYVPRLTLKQCVSPIRGGGTDCDSRSLIVFTPGAVADKVYLQLTGTAAPLDKIITGFYITDGDKASVCGKYDFPVIQYTADTIRIIQNSWVDEALIIQPSNKAFDEDLMGNLITMGIIVHCTLFFGKNHKWIPMQSGLVGSFPVISSGLRIIPFRYALIKRAMDILGGIVGCIITAIIFPFVATAIYFCSPGPVIFRQERIGKNGKKFWIYKFRTMYLDADAKKQELSAQNIMGNNLMFKVNGDPRIIGSDRHRIDGSPVGLGNFLRCTSIDELPQFWNVLKGEMSLVGTRPPTVDEFNQYDIHHRARLFMRPGITGLWQISGRNQITDFEEVVRLDMEYIKNWSIYLDCKILLKTIFYVLIRKGAQ